MVNRTIANSLNLGGTPISSTGVVPIKKPALMLVDRPPTVNDDSKQYIIGTIWIVLNRSLADPYQMWYLADNALGQPGNYSNATWLRVAAGGTGYVSKIFTTNDGNTATPVANQFIFTGNAPISVTTTLPNTINFTLTGGGTFADSFPTDSGTATPSAGVLNVFGSVGGAGHTGDNINTSASGDTVVVHLNKALHMPSTTADGLQGIWYTAATGSPLAGGNIFMSNLGTGNTFLGELAGNLTLTVGSAKYNSGFGSGNLGSLTTGTQNTTGGFGAGTSITTASDSVLIGYASGAGITTKNKSVAVGSESMAVFVSDTGGPWVTSPVAVGYSALASATTQSQDSADVAVGFNALKAATDVGGANTAVGSIALAKLNDVVGNAYGNTALGSGAMNDFLTGNENTAVGSKCMQRTSAGSSGSNNTAVGEEAMGSLSATAITGSRNTVMGNASGYVISSGNDLVLIGYQAGGSLTTNSNAVAIGSQALLTAAGDSGGTEVAVGYQSQKATTHAIGGNTSVGYKTLIAMLTSADGTTSGSANTAMGSSSGLTLTTGNSNSFYGQAAGEAVTTGSFNTALGKAALGNNGAAVTGSNNIAIGYDAALAFAGSESSNIIIQSTNAISAGISNTLYIGSGTGSSAGQINKSFISGIRGITTTNADAVAVLVDSAGQLGTVSSSERYKEQIVDMPDVSEYIAKLRPVSFKYKQHPEGSKSFGLIAEEVESVIPALVVYDKEGQPDTIKYSELMFFMLKEIQALRKEVDALKRPL